MIGVKMHTGIISKVKNIFYRLKTPMNVSFRSPIGFNKRMHFSGDGYIEIGKWTRNCGEVEIESVRKESSIIIGDNVFFNKNCMIVCLKKIVIGNNCMFGPNVYIYDHDHRFTSEKVYPREFNAEEISIGNNVWCGANAVILRGTIIGDGTVIGAGAIVKGVVPEHTVVYSSSKLVIRPI